MLRTDVNKQGVNLGIIRHDLPTVVLVNVWPTHNNRRMLIILALA